MSLRTAVVEELRLTHELARLSGHAVVVDEDMMAHTQLGNDNLLIYAKTTGGVLEVAADDLPS